MAKSTKHKTPKEIIKVRKMFASGLTPKEIALELSYSVNTVKKIIHRTHGYEEDIFKITWGGKKHSSPTTRSEVDGEILHLQAVDSKDGYIRISKNGKRTSFHRHEAAKILKKRGKQLTSKMVIHHDNHNRIDNRLENLVLFESNSLHGQYHGQMEIAMYQFLEQKNLLNQFYKDNPKLKLKTLKDMLNDTMD